jgi:hypothetical protein
MKSSAHEDLQECRQTKTGVENLNFKGLTLMPSLP